MQQDQTTVSVPNATTSDSIAPEEVSAMKMKTRSMARASRSSAHTDTDSKKAQAANPEEGAALTEKPAILVDPSSSPDEIATCESGKPTSDNQEELQVPKEEQPPAPEESHPEAMVQEAKPSATEPEAEAKAEAEMTPPATEEAPASDEVAKNQSQKSSPVTSKKRPFSAITKDEKADDKEAAATESKTSSKRLRLNDGTVVQAPVPASKSKQSDGAGSKKPVENATMEEEQPMAISDEAQPATVEEQAASPQEAPAETVAVEAAPAEEVPATDPSEMVEQVTEQVQQLSVKEDEAPATTMIDTTDAKGQPIYSADEGKTPDDKPADSQPDELEVAAPGNPVETTKTE